MVYMLGSYYESVCAIIAYYLVASFREPLPWAYCRPEWGSNCIDSMPSDKTALDVVEGGVTIANKAINNLTVNFDNIMRSSNRTISSSEWFFV